MIARRLATSALGVVALSTLAATAHAQDCPQQRPTDASGFGGYVYPSGAKSFATPGGGGRVWWTETGEHAPVLTSTRPDGVPDAVAAVGQVLDEAIVGYAQMGYVAPLGDGSYPACASNGGDGRVDVYLVRFVGADGQTVTERCATVGGAQRCPGFILVERNFVGKGYPSAQVGAQTVVAHEYFHLVQDAYDAGMDHWWAEGSAQWATKQLYPTLRDLEANLPAFFSQVSRPMDVPPGGAVAGYLYGSAIWPVFLGEHHGKETVRGVMDAIGTGLAALPAADQALSGLGTTLADEYGTFAIWNAATGNRAGAGGYADAATYPQVAIAGFPDGVDAQLTGITAGFASNYFRAADPAARTIELVADAARLGGYAVPVLDGKVQVDKAVALPAEVSGEAVIVLAGRSAKKTDVPWTLKASAPPAPTPTPSDTGSSGGCAVATGRSEGGVTFGALVVGLALAAATARGRRAAAAARPRRR